MAKLKINERTVEALQAEIDHHKREKSEVLRENDSLRSTNQMLLEVLNDLTEDTSYWNTEDTSVQTMLWRLKNLLNNLKNG
jgi:regulator of replication initiation timing